MVNNFVFVDEIEHNVNNNPTLFYMCLVVIKREEKLISDKVNNLLLPLGEKGFHAKRIYKKNSPNLALMKEMTEFIIDNKINWFCFSYSKIFKDSPRLKVLKEVEFSDWKPNIDNYREVGFYFLLHSLNSFLSELNYKPDYQLVFDEDVLKKYCQIIPGRGILKHIYSVCGVSPKQAPIINLCDHVGYLFGKCLRDAEFKDGKIDYKQYGNKSLFVQECLSHVLEFARRRQFHYRSIWDWIDFENNILDSKITS